MKPRQAYWCYRTGAALTGTLPLPLARGIGAFGGHIAATLATKRSTVEANLSVICPDVSSRTRRHLARAAFSSYGTYWTEGAYLVRRARAGRFPSFSVDGLEHIEDAVAAQRGLILALPHLGCWEFGGRFLFSRDIRLLTVAEVLEPPEINDWFITTRRAIGIDVLPLGAASATTLLQRLRDGGEIALLGDRDVTNDGVAVKFFGRPTTLPAGPALLALRSGAALVPCAIYHRPHGHHHAVVLPPIEVRRVGRLRDDVQRVTTSLVAAYESLILRAPEQWHVFQPSWPDTTTDASLGARQHRRLHWRDRVQQPTEAMSA